MRTVKIKGTQMKIKPTLRALFIFEEIKGGKFEIERLLDNYLFLYCVILANNPDCNMTWDEFIDVMDNDPTLVDEINSILKTAEEIDKILTGDKSKDEKKN